MPVAKYKFIVAIGLVLNLILTCSSNKNSSNRQPVTTPFGDQIAYSDQEEISTSLLRKLTPCSAPFLNLKEKTITSNIEWSIFSHCVLDIIPEKEYPQIEEMATTEKAYEVVRSLKPQLLAKHAGSPLSLDENFALFERIFLITRFRMVTQSERNDVRNRINGIGITQSIEQYLQAWFISRFYQEHFDFSRNPNPAYESWRVSGQIVNGEDDIIEGAKYQTTENIFGYILSGTTNDDSSNFAMQFYAPHSSFSNQEYANRFNLVGIPNTKANKILPVLVSLEGYDTNFSILELREQKETNSIKIILQKEGTTPEPDPNTTYPAIDLTNDSGVQLPNISWSTKTGNSINNCNRPRIVTQGSKQVIDGYKWQEFIKCYLNYSLHQTDNGLNYISLADERSAFDLITTTKDGFLESDQSLNLANIEIVDKIYGIVTFKSLSSADKESVISMLSC